MARNYGKRARVTCKLCNRDVAALDNNRGPRQHNCPHGRVCGMQACAECGSKDAVGHRDAVQEEQGGAERSIGALHHRDFDPDT